MDRRHILDPPPRLLSAFSAIKTPFNAEGAEFLAETAEYFLHGKGRSRKMVTVEQKKLAEIEDYIDGDIEPAGETDLIPVLDQKSKVKNQRSLLIYIILPLIFMAATLLGGLRLGAVDNAFIFLKPPLVCLVFATLSLVLFVRSGVIDLGGWFSEEFSAVQNAANGLILTALFTATVQLFNSLLPEQGLPFWVVGFCFFWTIWNNLFAEFDTKRLLRSMIALFGFAFVVKYLLLANLTAPPSESWLQRMIENPGREAFTWLLDLPRYAAGTGYIQFFTVTLYMMGLFLTPRTTSK